MDKKIITIKPFKKSHIKETFAWVKDEELQKLFMMREKPTWENHVKYFNKILNDNTQKVFAIYYDDMHVGNCGLKNITQRDAEFWIYLGNKKFKHKGIGTFATNLLLDMGFNYLNLDTIYLHVANFNIFAINMYKNIGFKQVQLDMKTIEQWGNRSKILIKMEIKR